MVYASSNEVPAIKTYRVLENWNTRSEVMSYQECYDFVLKHSGTTYTRATELGDWQISPVGTEITPDTVLKITRPDKPGTHRVRVIENFGNAIIRAELLDHKHSKNDTGIIDATLRGVVEVVKYAEPSAE